MMIPQLTQKVQPLPTSSRQILPPSLSLATATGNVPHRSPSSSGTLCAISMFLRSWSFTLTKVMVSLIRQIAAMCSSERSTGSPNTCRQANSCNVPLVSPHVTRARLFPWSLVPLVPDFSCSPTAFAAVYLAESYSFPARCQKQAHPDTLFLWAFSVRFDLPAACGNVPQRPFGWPATRLPLDDCWHGRWRL